MPKGNRTGPMGMGSMTGRVAGYCAGFGLPGFSNSVAGRGLGAGFRRGPGVSGTGFGGRRGRRNMFYATRLPGWMRYGGYTPVYNHPASSQDSGPEIEKQALKNQAHALQSEIDIINKRLSEIEA